ncbi:MAG: hypothetical protein M1831_005492 [Alyxoria varia]|nr:MAG: hypothetical protein M1831_005492 [Alyxoria varia]
MGFPTSFQHFVTLISSIISIWSTSIGAAPTASGQLVRRDGIAIPRLDGDMVPMSPNDTGEYIRVTRRPDSRLVGGYKMLTPDGLSILKTVQSVDDGATWGELGEVFRGETALHDADNAFPFALKDGTILYAYRNHERTPEDDYSWFRISISYSGDGGQTFKYLTTVDERARDGTNGLWEPFLRYAIDGSIQIYYSSEVNEDGQDSLMKTSTDGGKTWSDSKVISGEDSNSRDGMVGVAPIDNDGNLIAVFESNPTGRFQVDSVTSPDDGKTWGNRHNIYTAEGADDGHTAGAPQVLNVWGTLVVSFMTDESLEQKEYANGEVKILTSTDGGKTWGQKLKVFDAKNQWPGLFVLGPDDFLVTSQFNNRAYSQKVTIQRDTPP